MHTQNMQRNVVKNMRKNVLVRAFKILLPDIVINLAQIKSYISLTKRKKEKECFSDVNFVIAK